MKMIHVLLIQSLFLVYSETKEYNFFPRLPAGQYKLNFIGMSVCEKRNPDLQHNYYLYKKSNTTEIRGNTTQKILFDDSFDFNVNMAVKDSIGGWKDNAYNYKAPKACSVLKRWLGAEWEPYMKSLGISNLNCPISPGVYVLKGYDLQNFAKFSNIPKTFFYGTYKFRIHSSKKEVDSMYGCVTFVVEVARPWEAND